MSSINVNGTTYTGSTITINNGKITIDGRDVTPDAKEVNIHVDGNIQNLQADACNRISVTGDVGEVRTHSGDVWVGGDVAGSVQTMSGNVTCGHVGGSVRTMSGHISHQSTEQP